MIADLGALAPHDWEGFFTDQLEGKREGTQLDGIARGGYRLVYRDTPSDFTLSSDLVFGSTALTFSIGLAVAGGGVLTDILWDGPAFAAGLTVGSEIVAVGGRKFSPDILKQAVTDSRENGSVDLLVRSGQHVRDVRIAYDGGHRYPHLERVEGTRARLDQILAPLCGRPPSP